MPTIAYNAVDEFCGRTAASAWPPVTLICGEEMLCKRALGGVLEALIPPAERAMGLEVVDGGDGGIGDALTSLNTFAMLARTKVVVLQDARLFYSAGAGQGLGEKMAQAARGGDMKKASRALLNLMALTGLAYDDLADPDRRRELVDDIDGEAPPWFVQLIDYCRENHLSVPDKQDDADLLEKAMHKGFPDGHRLVVTTDFVDRRKALFKAIEAAGLVVDCSVPKGASRADRTAQEAVMQAVVDDALAEAGIRMDGDARRRLIEWTGFDLRTLSGNVDKLISFVGVRQRIADADVTALLERTRKDPIFEFTNALAEKDLPAALACMQGLLGDGMHPLQLLAAAANQVRRLLLAKDFIMRDGGRSWTRTMTFAQFKTAAFNAVLADDKMFATLMQDWDDVAASAAGAKKRAKTGTGDLVLARNPKSPFPVFQTLKKADAFSLQALASAMADLSEADLRIKSTGQDPRLLLEAVLIRMCRGAAAGPPVEAV